MIRTWPLAVVLAACGAEGSWRTEVWGEPFIEQGIPAEAFADGCSVAFDSFVVVVSGRALVDDAGGVVASLDGAGVYDLTASGPHEMGVVSAPSGTWRGMKVTVAPEASAAAGNATADQVAAMVRREASILVQGTLTCNDIGRSFDWAFGTATDYACDPTNLVIPVEAAATTQLTIHGDHLFYDSLWAEDAEVRGLALWEADADENGSITQEELARHEVAPYYPDGLGAFDDATNFERWLEVAAGSVGHVDGEGHCDVSRRD
jgi:hypothetical protein